METDATKIHKYDLIKFITENNILKWYDDITYFKLYCMICRIIENHPEASKNKDELIKHLTNMMEAINE